MIFIRCPLRRIVSGEICAIIKAPGNSTERRRGDALAPFCETEASSGSVFFSELSRRRVNIRPALTP